MYRTSPVRLTDIRRHRMNWSVCTFFCIPPDNGWQNKGVSKTLTAALFWCIVKAADTWNAATRPRELTLPTRRAAKQRSLHISPPSLLTRRHHGTGAGRDKRRQAPCHGGKGGALGCVTRRQVAFCGRQDGSTQGDISPRGTMWCWRRINTMSFFEGQSGVGEVARLYGSQWSPIPTRNPASTTFQYYILRNSIQTEHQRLYY